MRAVPMTMKDARKFCAQIHRKLDAPIGGRFAVGATTAQSGGLIVGVAIAGNPRGRGFDDGVTLEVTRLAVREGARNACSFLYSHIGRAAAALGYEWLITYVEGNEHGFSLKASGFHCHAYLDERSASEWSARPNRTGKLFDREGASGDRFRWERRL